MVIQEVQSMLKLKLDLDTFESRKYKTLIESVEQQDYEFVSLQDLLQDSELSEKLFSLVEEGVLNSPQSDGQFESYKAFCEQLLQRCYLDVADGYVIAKRNNEWIGLTGITVDSKTGIGQSGLTVVKKSYQGKGIAKVLKVLSLTQAAKQGAKIVVTENYPTNTPMLAINTFVGFVTHD